MAAKLTKVPKYKADLSNKEKFIKIGAFFKCYHKEQLVQKPEEIDKKF